MSVVGVLLVALATGAAPTRVTTVVRVVGSAAAPDRAIAEAARAGLQWLVDVDALAYDDRARLADEVRRCGEDNGCVFARLASSGVDLGVYVVANFEVEPPLITLELLDAQRRRAIARELVDIGDGAVGVAVTRAVEQAFVRAGVDVGGALIPDVVPAEATVTLDDRAAEVGVARLLRVGPHVLRARLDGYEAVERRVTIDPREARRVEVRMQAEPGLFSRWWFWTAVGVVAVGGVTAAVVATRPDTIGACHEVGGGTCPP